MKKSSSSSKKILVAVVGSHKSNSEVDIIATKLGNLLSKVGVILISGGLGGVMESVSKGMSSGGGISVGILPGDDKYAANAFVDIPIPTGLGNTRNTLVAGVADIIIALPGEYGTLSEIAFALNMKKPVIGLGSWDIKGMHQVKTPEEAVNLVKQLTGQPANRRGTRESGSG